MIAALVIGILLAVGALSYVLYPLFFDRPVARPAAALRRAAATGEDPVAVLREIEFDRATGKLSEPDYLELKTEWTRRALAAMRERDAARAAAPVPDEPALDPVEAAIRRARATTVECPEHGPRPEPDAVYCGDCGRYLAGRCADCDAPVDEPGSRFCNACGHVLAAV